VADDVYDSKEPADKGHEVVATKIVAQRVFPTARLSRDEVRDIEVALKGTRTIWRFGRHENVGESIALTYNVQKVFELDSLDELTVLTPKGRLFGLEVESSDGSGTLRLTFGKDFHRARNVHILYEGEGDEVPERFHDLVRIIYRAQERGKKWYLAAVLAATSIVMAPTLVILDLTWPSLGVLSERPPVEVERPTSAVIFAALSLVFLLPLGSSVGSRLQASSVVLRYRLEEVSVRLTFNPRESARRLRIACRQMFAEARRILSVRSILKLVFQWPGRAARRIFSFWQYDEASGERKMLMVTTTSAFVTILSLCVAILAWLRPMK
jgi:hypothetical protein